MSQVLATTTQQDEDIPGTITVPKPEGSPALGPTNSPAHQSGTPPLPVPPLLDIPFVGTPLVGCSFDGFIACLTQEKQDCSYSSSLSNHHDKRTHVDSQDVKASNDHSTAQGNEDMPKLLLEAGPSSEQQGEEPTSPLFSPTRATTDPDGGTAAEIQGVLENRPPPLRCVKGEWG